MRGFPCGWSMALGLVLLPVGVACSGSGGSKDAGKEQLGVCTTQEDCKRIDEYAQCVDGQCLISCTTHDVCNSKEYCSRQGFCRIGCRDTTSCTGTNEVCVDGSCVDRSQVTLCTTKADCTDPPRICVNEACVDPPATCNGNNECPGQQTCNGFTHVCEDPVKECNTAADCANKPQCTSGCTCNSQGQCVTATACTVENEATVCGRGKFCDSTASPAACANVPPCTRQADCDAKRLACNKSTNLCQRSPGCTDASTCTSPFTFCVTTVGFCQEPTCTNGAITCTGTDMCRTNGTCGPAEGTPCTTHNDCPSTPEMRYCNDTYKVCMIGCRDNNNCQSPQTCNEDHVCVGNTPGGDGATCSVTNDCLSGFVCVPLVYKCREECKPNDCPPCPLTGFGCLGPYCSSTVPPLNVDAGCVAQ